VVALAKTIKASLVLVFEIDVVTAGVTAFQENSKERVTSLVVFRCGTWLAASSRTSVVQASRDQILRLVCFVYIPRLSGITVGNGRPCSGHYLVGNFYGLNTFCVIYLIA